MTMVLAGDQLMVKQGMLKTFSWYADSGTQMHGHFRPECGTRI